MIFGLTRTKTVTFPRAVDEELVSRAVKFLRNQYCVEYTVTTSPEGFVLKPNLRTAHGNSFWPEVTILLGDIPSAVCLSCKPSVATRRGYPVFLGFCGFLLLFAALIFLVGGEGSILFLLAPLGMALFCHFFFHKGADFNTKLILRALETAAQY